MLGSTGIAMIVGDQIIQAMNIVVTPTKESLPQMQNPQT